MPKYSPFVLLKRRAARVALYSSVGASVAVVLGLVWWLLRPVGPFEEGGRTTEAWEALAAVDLLQRYIRIDTSEREIEGARFLVEQLSAAGLDPTLEALGDGHANVWAILEGESSDAIVLHHHIDVSTAPLADEWEYPPFDAVIDPPFLYGRGAFDMKAIGIAQLEAIKALAAAGAKPARSIIFLATSGEERGSDLGTRWILRHHPEIVERFDLVLTEGGVVEPIRVSEVKYWGIETGQKLFAEGEACAATREPLEELSRLMATGQRYIGVPRTIPEVERFLESYAATREDPRLVELIGDVATGSVELWQFRIMPSYLRSLFLDQIIPFPVEELADGGYRMRLVASLLPGSDFDEVIAELLPPWLVHGLDVRFDPPAGAIGGSRTDTADYRTLERHLRRAVPDTTVGPYFLAWSATDARYFRQAGIASYGWSPFLVFSTESFRADAKNERINLPGYVRGLELYLDAVRELSSR